MTETSTDVGQFPSEASGPAGPRLPVPSFCFQAMLTVPENEKLLDFLKTQRDITLKYFLAEEKVKEEAQINWNFYATSFEKAKEASGEEMKIKDWRSFVVQTSTWIDCDSDSPELSAKSKQQLAYELEYCTYLKGIKAVIIDLKRLDSDNLIDVLKEFAEKTEYFKTERRYKFSIWVKVPTTIRKLENEKGNHFECDPWYWWYQFRTRLSNPPYLNVILDVKIEMGPNGLFAYTPVDRWFGESVVGVTVKTDCFQFDKSDATVQMKQYSYHFFKKAFGYGTESYYCILYGEIPDWPTNIKVVDDMNKCLRYCWKRRQEKRKFSWSAGRSCRDSPCRAIHPLTDDVTVDMYNDWETDKEKYDCYYKAIHQQLNILTEKTSQPVVMVLGAGQGPLVIELMKAIKHIKTVLLQISKYNKTNYYVNSFEPVVYAVEKNPKAWNLLFRRNEELWNGEVHLVTGDFRNWKPKVKADLIISEFIGGFGCNELSPECIDGALHLCKAETRSIPLWYENSLMPVMSRNIMREIVVETKTLNEKLEPLPHKWKTIVGDVIDIADLKLEYIERKMNKEQDPKDGFQHMWICRVHNRFQIGEEKILFKFVHPNWPKGNDKYLTKTLTWTACEDCELSGFVGAFSVTLTDNKGYFGIMEMEDVERVAAWFPVFIPLKNPVFVSKGSEIELDFSRKADNRKVWYEWQLKKPVQSMVHNQLGLHDDMPTTSDTEEESEGEE